MSSEHALKVVADHHRTLAVEAGSKFRITTNRKKYPLDKVQSKKTGRGAVTEFRNSPTNRALGSWVIVTLGSQPHVIAPRGVSRKVKRLSNAFESGRKLTRSQARTAASLVTGQGLFAGVKPLFVTGVGPRFVVQHPGHKSIGTPWADAERASDRVSERMFDDATIEHAVRVLTK